jgi:hypothetical protein
LEESMAAVTYDVEVALIGEPDSVPPGPVTEEEWSIAWTDRTRARISVESWETLETVVERGADALAVQPWEAPFVRRPIQGFFGYVLSDLFGDLLAVAVRRRTQRLLADGGA